MLIIVEKLFFAIQIVLILLQKKLIVRSDDDKIVCYDFVGCFDGFTVFNKTYFPDKPKKVSTTFLVFTKPDPFRHKQLVHYRNVSTLSFINRSSPIVIIVHGWVVASDNLMYVQLRNALFNHYDTVIAVDWRKGASIDSYPQSVVNTALVGRETGELIRLLIKTRKISPDQIYIIGFSLGAHVSGAAGRWLEKRMGKKVGRITALDGAGPLIGDSKLAIRLGDATLIDAIHTNGGDFDDEFVAHLGHSRPMGNIDFFPNGGREQPNCAKNTIDLACNHHSAIYYYMSSIKPCTYLAQKCESWKTFSHGNCSYPDSINARMGYYANETEHRGSFYLITSELSPYCEVNRKTKVSTKKGSSK